MAEYLEEIWLRWRSNENIWRGVYDIWGGYMVEYMWRIYGEVYDGHIWRSIWGGYMTDSLKDIYGEEYVKDIWRIIWRIYGKYSAVLVYMDYRSKEDIGGVCIWCCMVGWRLHMAEYMEDTGWMLEDIWQRIEVIQGGWKMKDKWRRMENIMAELC